MTEGGSYQQTRLSPTSLAVVIALHGAAITALALSKTEFVVKEFTPLKTVFVPDQVDPPPEPREVEPQPERPAEYVTYTPPKIDLPKPKTIDLVAKETVDIPTFDATPPRIPAVIDVPPPAPPAEKKADPVRIAAVMRSDVEKQPPYPASEQRAGAEGSVTVRLLIGTDGRVKSVTRVRASSEAFFRSTERQALRHWRFQPATVDGRPVESTQTVTVHFELMG